MGVRTSSVLSVIALIIAIVGCFFAVRIYFFQPAPLSEEKVSAVIEEKTKDFVTEEEIKKMIDEAIASLKPVEKGGE